jgi:hypothetical protein
MLGTGLAGRGVGGRSRSQRRQGGRGRERHNRGRCPSPDYLGGLGRRASICHAMSRLSGRNRVETNTENGWMVPVLRPVVNQHFHVIGLLPADCFVRCMSRTMHRLREYVDPSGLISYGPSWPDEWRRAAEYIDKILRGAKPADIPVEQPTKFDLIINLTTARAFRSNVS